MNQIQIFKKFLDREKNIFDGAHKVPTPFGIVREVLGKIDLVNYQQILVLYNVEFVIELVYNNKVSKEKITFFSDHKDKSKLMQRIGVRVVNHLEELQSKHFDLGLMNSPFQDEKKNPLYYKFHNTVLDYIKPDGVLVEIAPKALPRALAGDGIIKGQHKVTQKKILLVNIADEIKTKYFPKYGSDFSYTIIKNQPFNPIDDYTVITNEGSHFGKLPTRELKIAGDKTINSVLDKILEDRSSSDRGPYGGGWFTAGSSKFKKSPNGKDVVARKISADGKKLETYKGDWTGESKLLGRPKVFISGFGDKSYIAYDHRLVCSVEKALFTVPTDSNLQSENIHWLINDSEIFKFFNKVVKSRGPRVHFIRQLKRINLDSKLTNELVYKHFGITDNEQDKIRSII